MGVQEREREACTQVSSGLNSLGKTTYHDRRQCDKSEWMNSSFFVLAICGSRHGREGEGLVCSVRSGGTRVTRVDFNIHDCTAWKLSSCCCEALVRLGIVKNDVLRGGKERCGQAEETRPFVPD